MATAVISRSTVTSGLRPVEPSRDLASVADLIQAAFASDLDREGQSMLREMRSLSRMGPLLWWFDRPGVGFSSLLSGFVWVEDDQIVGNVTVNPAASSPHRWVISNVAVADDYRGRGIARHLMDAAFEFIRLRSGRVVTLQVRDDNLAALHIYQTMGFREIFGTTFWRLNQTPSVQPILLQRSGLRHRRFGPEDTHKIYQLARRATPENVQAEHPLRFSEHSLGIEARITGWLRGQLGSVTPLRLVLENQDYLDAMISAEPDTHRRGCRVKLIVHPTSRGMVEGELISLVLYHLSHYPRQVVRAVHPTFHPQGNEAFRSSGFQKERTLLWMKCEI